MKYSQEQGKSRWFALNGAGNIFYVGEFSGIEEADTAASKLNSLLVLDEGALVSLLESIRFLLRIYGTGHA